jgi:hypothetical protein
MKAVPILLLASSIAGLPQERKPSLAEVLSRAGDYVVRYHEAMTTVVAEERYVQKLTAHTKSGSGVISEETPAEERTLLSDFVIISGVGGEPPWMTFRDVLEVDGRPVRDGRHQLQALLSSGAVDRAKVLSTESARYNLGPQGFIRTINIPTLALDLLLPSARTRFRFRHQATRVDAAGGTVWQITYQEKERPTIIKTPDGASVVARGTFWIDPREGRVVESMLDLWGGRARISVVYEVEPRLHIAVPVRMVENYLLEKTQLDGIATYSNYRRFETAARVISK